MKQWQKRREKVKILSSFTKPALAGIIFLRMNLVCLFSKMFGLHDAALDGGWGERNIVQGGSVDV